MSRVPATSIPHSCLGSSEINAIHTHITTTCSSSSAMTKQGRRPCRGHQESHKAHQQGCWQPPRSHQRKVSPQQSSGSEWVEPVSYS
eukprot:285794-Amphidinium_carterae.1